MLQGKRLTAIAIAGSFMVLSLFGVTSSASASVGYSAGPTSMAGSAKLGLILPNPDLNTVLVAAAFAYAVTKDLVTVVTDSSSSDSSSSSSESSSSSSGGMVTNAAGNPVTPATFDAAQ